MLKRQPPVLNVNLLTVAANHLEAIKDKLLPMNKWLTSISEIPDMMRDRFVIHECGYAGCALGECSFLSEFEAVGITRDLFLASGSMFPAWLKVKAVLGLTEDQMSYLFNQSTYPNYAARQVRVPAIKVAERMRQLIAQPDFQPNIAALETEFERNFQEQEFRL